MLATKNVHKKRYGRLRVESITGIPLMLEGLKGLYDSGEYSDFTVVFLCDCGRYMSTLDSEFKGQESCGVCSPADSIPPSVLAAGPGRPRKSGVSVTIQLRWPQATKLMQITNELDELERAVKQAVDEYLAYKVLAPMPEWWDGTLG